MTKEKIYDILKGMDKEECILDPKATVKKHKKIKRGNPNAIPGGASPNPNWAKDRNAGGRPKGRVSINNFLHRELIDHPDKARAIAKKLISLALAGNLQAIQEILDRTDGKVAEVHKIDSENPITLLLAPAQQLLNTQVIDVKPVELLDGAAFHKLSSTEPEEIKSLEGAPS